MTTKLTDPMGRAFIEFCKSQGVKFVDSDTGKEITFEEEENEPED